MQAVAKFATAFAIDFCLQTTEFLVVKLMCHLGFSDCKIQLWSQILFVIGDKSLATAFCGG